MENQVQWLFCLLVEYELLMVKMVAGSALAGQE